MEATETVLRAGYRLDRYELLCPIASGGMATVWLARLRGKRGFEKLFAVKTIRTELVDDARFQEMFLDEARIASGIQHPNVAQILDLGEQNDVLFIVMEWVDGDSLAKIRKLLAKRSTRLPVGIVLRVIAEACAGLHAAHELRDDRGEPLEIVHRDVSPHNILLSSSGAVKVIDFGIAKAQNRLQGETRTGIVKGKVQYMAPEQVRKGALVDRRADVWSLGMCLHELAMGRLPYGDEDEVGVIRMLMSNEAPAISPDVLPAIARVLDRSVVIDPDERFPTAAGMQRAVEAAMKELGESVSSEDAAAFLRSELPEPARRRREAVGRAIEDARERGTPVESRDEVAFAATVVGERDLRAQEREEEGAIALTKVKGGPSALGATDESHVAAVEQEPIKIPKRSHGWLWAVLLLLGAAAGAAVKWPAAAGGVLTTLGWKASPRAPLPQETSSPGREAQATAGEPEARPATSTVTATRVTPKEPMVPSAVSAGVRPSPDTPPPRTSPVRPPALPTGAVSAVEAPDASAPAASAAPALAPAASEDDPNNPYNN
jgi:tRNA A-37 threonylcarbamoyl transferase component Bud32